MQCILKWHINDAFMGIFKNFTQQLRKKVVIFFLQTLTNDNRKAHFDDPILGECIKTTLYEKEGKKMLFVKLCQCIQVFFFENAVKLNEFFYVFGWRKEANSIILFTFSTCSIESVLKHWSVLSVRMVFSVFCTDLYIEQDDPMIWIYVWRIQPNLDNHLIWSKAAGKSVVKVNG